MQRNRVPAILVALCLGAVLSGCSKDEEVKATTQELRATAKAVDEAAKGAKGARAAADAAAKALEEKLPGLKSKFEAVKDARGFQVSDAVMKDLGDAVASTTMGVCGLKIEYVAELAENTPENKAAEAKLDKICKDWSAALGAS